MGGSTPARFYAVILGVAATLVVATIGQEHVKYTHFTLTKDAHITTGIVAQDVYADSAMHCSTQCTTNILCVGAEFDKTKSSFECRLFTSDTGTNLTLVPDLGMISMLPRPRSCADMKKLQGRHARSGVHKFCTYANHDDAKRFCYRAHCDQETEGGGWTVFQRRLDGSVDFYRGWNEYKNGFGNIDGEYWLGLDLIHQLTAAEPAQLRVDLEDFDGNMLFSAYAGFHVANESDLYKLTVENYKAQSTAGDSFTMKNDSRFSTWDADYDSDERNCAQTFHGAWWYLSCHRSNLNGDYKGGPHSTLGDGVNWHSWRGYHYSLKTTEMKVRPTIGA